MEHTAKYNRCVEKNKTAQMERYGFLKYNPFAVCTSTFKKAGLAIYKTVKGESVAKKGKKKGKKSKSKDHKLAKCAMKVRWKLNHGTTNKTGLKQAWAICRAAKGSLKKINKHLSKYKPVASASTKSKKSKNGRKGSSVAACAMKMHHSAGVTLKRAWAMCRTKAGQLKAKAKAKSKKAKAHATACYGEFCRQGKKMWFNGGQKSGFRGWSGFNY